MHTHTFVRRHGMAGTCLLALPAALSLAHPAQGQSVIGAVPGIGVNLTAYGAQPVSIASGVNISAIGWAAVTDSVAANLSNAGSITDPAGNGVYLGAGGVLTNTGSISGANAVRLNAAGAVANAGVIQGANYGVLVNNGTGQVTNSGAIAAGYDGISLNQGGVVTNTGSIFGGHIGVYTGNGLGSVNNSGVISARTGDAVSLYSGGSLTNTATGQLLGGYSGAYAGGDGAHITNAGLIAGPLFGAYLTGASSISNTGTIAGGVDGVEDIGPGGVVDNAGLIHGGQIGVKLAAQADVENSGIISGGAIGVQLGRNGTLALAAGGRVTGGVTGVVAAAGDVLRNAGTIDGLNGIIANGSITLLDTGVISARADAISLSGGASNITLGTGAEIGGAITGGGTASQISLTGDGTLNTPISGFATGSAISVLQGASWVGEGHWQVAQLVNAGIFIPGLMGAPLSLTGNFAQTSTGTLRVVVTPQGIAPFAITGSAALAGTLNYVLAPGSYAPADDTFLTATGGVTGGFALVTTTQPATQTPLLAISGHISIPGHFTIAPTGSALFAETSQEMALAAEAGGQALLDHTATGGSGNCTALPAGSKTGAAGIAQALAGGFCAAGGWMQASGGALSAPGDFSATGGGFLAGLDRADALGGRLGLAVGYDTANLKDKAGNRAGLDNVRLGLYAAQPLGAFALSAEIMDGIVSTNTTRATGAGAATAKGNANVLSAAAQIALPLSLYGADVTPAFGLRIASVSTGRLNESAANAAFALSAAPASGTSVAPYLRVIVAKRFITASQLAITPDFSLGAAVAAENPGADTRLTAQDGTPFNSRAAHLAPLSGQFGAGLSVGRGAWTLTLRYAGEAAGNWLAQSVQAGIAARF